MEDLPIACSTRRTGRLFAHSPDCQIPADDGVSQPMARRAPRRSQEVEMKRTRPRTALAALALGILAGPMVASGETADDAPSRVIVGLRLPWSQEGLLAPAAQEDQRFAIGSAQEELLDELRGTDARLIHNFTSIPFQVLEVTPAALDRLRSSPLVSGIEPDRVLKPTLAESVPLIQGDQAWAAVSTGREPRSPSWTRESRRPTRFSEGASWPRLASRPPRRTW
jgi:hypothetical protein